MAHFLRITKDTIINVDELQKIEHSQEGWTTNNLKDYYRVFMHGFNFEVSEETYNALCLFLNAKSIEL